MKIRRLETFCNDYVGFVRVTADDGSQGWGQVSPYNADITCQIFHRQVARWALGQDALDIEALVTTIPEREQDNLYAPALVAEDGKVRIPDGPGWGVEIDKG